MSILNKLRTILSYITVEPVLFFYMFCITIESTLVSDNILIKSCLAHTNITANETFKCYHLNKYVDTATYNLVHNEAVAWNGYFMSVLSLFTFFMCPFIGNWSDHFGRKKPMIMAPLGSVLAVIVLIVINLLNIHGGFFLISAAISGITGGVITINTNAFGYISDVTDEAARSKRIVILEAMLFIGGTLGQITVGVLKTSIGYVPTYIIELMIHVIIIVYIWLRIRSVSNDRSAKLFDVSHIKEAFQTITKKRSNNKHVQIILLLIASICIFYGFTIQLILTYNYLTENPFNWDVKKYSLFSGLNSGVCGFILLVGLPIMLHWFHLQDVTACTIGVLSRAAGLVLLGLSSGWEVWLCPVLFMFSELSVPMLRSMLSKLVSPEENGKIFTFLGMIQNFCFLSGSFGFTKLYNLTKSFFYGFTFEMVAALQIIPLGFLFFIALQQAPREDYERIPSPTPEDQEYVKESPNAEGLKPCV